MSITIIVSEKRKEKKNMPEDASRASKAPVCTGLVLWWWPLVVRRSTYVERLKMRIIDLYRHGGRT